jgi:hypothetical protein
MFGKPKYNAMCRTYALTLALSLLSLLCSCNNPSQKVSDATTALHALQPDYRVPYGSQSIEKIIILHFCDFTVMYSIKLAISSIEICDNFNLCVCSRGFLRIPHS